jgi:hypothetical protein
MRVKWKAYLDDPRDVASWRAWLFSWFHWSHEAGTTTGLRVCGISIHRYQWHHYKRFDNELSPLSLDHRNS